MWFGQVPWDEGLGAEVASGQRETMEPAFGDTSVAGV